MYAAWFAEVCERTAVMVAHWMRVGFVHGVMNTDNMSILGLTIDYGPFGWIDNYDPDWTPNTTDAQGRRYRFGWQPRVAGWNLSRFAQALSHCRGQYVFLCDQDDLWLPGKRDALVAALERDALLAVSDAQVIDADGRVIEDSFMARRGGFRGGFLHTLVKNRYLGCAMAFRRELLDEVLPIPSEVPMHDMWIGALAGLRGPWRTSSGR